MNNEHRNVVGRATLSAALLSLAAFAPPAWAYLDPGTGSMIISAIVGLFATVGLAVKTYWYKLKAFFRRDAQPETAGGEAAAEAEQRVAAQPAETRSQRER
jgi:hypothetical protein